MRDLSNYAKTTGLGNSLTMQGTFVSGMAYNATGGTLYLQLFEAAALPADTAVPIMSIPIPTQQAEAFAFAPGLKPQDPSKSWFLVLSSTDQTKTIAAANAGFIVGQYF